MSRKFVNKTICIFLLAIIVMLSCVSFVSCNWNDHDYYTRTVTNNDVIVEQDTSSLSSFSYVIRPQENITDFCIFFSFFDENMNPITGASKQLGDVIKGGEYRIQLTFPDDITFSQKASIKKYKVQFFRGFIIVDQNTKGICFKHKFGDGVITKQPTCYTFGEKMYSCTNCNYTQTERIASLEHSFIYSKTIKAVGCLTTGEDMYICTACTVRETRVVYPTLVHEDNNGDGKCDSCGRTIAA